jgi:D-arabinose 1-dehydrogenase-like Zn-dependent alcohol dehydrogenase
MVTSHALERRAGHGGRIAGVGGLGHLAIQLAKHVVA